MADIEDGAPIATAQNLSTPGAVVRIEVPISNMLVGDTVEIMRVPMSVLREWLKEETTT